tara:strand:- start:7 stop:219 length:213 start_codon:yes stop_codon:yes gene_type:complete
MKTITIDMTYDMLPDYMKDNKEPEFISEAEFNSICDNPQFQDDVTLPTWNLIEDMLLKFKSVPIKVSRGK